MTTIPDPGAPSIGAVRSNQQLDQPALEARMDALAQHLGSMGSDALRMLKLIIRNGISSGLHEQLGVEAVANGLTFQSQEFKDKKAAYLNSFKKGKK